VLPLHQELGYVANLVIKIICLVPQNPTSMAASSPAHNAASAEVEPTTSHIKSTSTSYLMSPAQAVLMGGFNFF
jgi:hypothetical protein